MSMPERAKAQKLRQRAARDANLSTCDMQKRVDRKYKTDESRFKQPGAWDITGYPKVKRNV